MSQVGINFMAWPKLTAQEIVRLLPDIKSMGYDGVEVPIFDLNTPDISLLRSALADVGLSCTVSTALPHGVTLVDHGTQSTGVRWLQNVIDRAASLGASVVCGPLAVPVGELRGRGYTTEEWRFCVRGLQEVGKVASANGVTVALEPINRFETFMVNTTSDATRLVEEVDVPEVGLLLDTFHMNIEEKSISSAIHHAGTHLKHFHCSENDRGIVGTGHIDWDEVFDALRMVEYADWLVVESFGSVVSEIASAACVWRPLAPSPDILARESIQYIHELQRRSG